MDAFNKNTPSERLENQNHAGIADTETATVFFT